MAEQAAVQRGRQAAAHVAQSAARVAYGTVFAMAAAGCAIAAIACGLTAVWIYAVPRVGPAGAPLIVAGILILVCIGVLLVMRYVLGRPTVTQRPAVAVGAMTPAVLHGEARRILKQYKGTAVVAAVLAGVVAGMNQR